jgi:hypothetical protein
MFSFSLLSHSSSWAGVLSAAFVVMAATPAQASEAQCILAGRLNQDGQWAPAANGVQLLDGAGQRIRSSGQAKLDVIKAVRLDSAALLSSCNEGLAMSDGNAMAGAKSQVPAISAGNEPIQVQAMSRLQGRAGSQWVELRLNVPAQRVVMLTR